MVTSSFTQGMVGVARLLASKYELHLVYLATSENRKEAELIGDLCVLHPVRCPKWMLPGGSLAATTFFQQSRLVPLFVVMAIEIWTVTKRHDIDIVHAQWAIPAGFLACLASRQVPVVITLRGSDINDFGKRKFFRCVVKYTLGQSTALTAVCNDLKARVEDLGASEDSIRVIPGGVDIDKFKPGNKDMLRERLPLPKRGKIILFCGNLVKAKGVDKLIRVSVRLSQDLDFWLFVIGDGPERPLLCKLAKDGGLKNVVFTGRIPYNAVPSYMAAADVFVLPSESEGLPGTVQEAMACGLPVIASNVGGLPELITDGVNGYLVESEEELQCRLEELMTSPDILAAMGVNAREFARQNLSIDKVVKQTEELYAAILAQKLITSEAGGMLRRT